MAPVACPYGSYCPTGTKFATEFLCPPGTLGIHPQFTRVEDCHVCPPKAYCSAAGSAATTGLCAAGYYCTNGSSTARPFDGITGDVCPMGAYCEEGSAAPTPCPAGSFSPTMGSSSPADCTLCEPGKYCTADGQAFKCQAGYLCIRGASSSPPPPLRFDAVLQTEVGGRACSNGTYCLEGALQELPCPRGSFNPVQGAATCLQCPAGALCPIEGMSTPSPCPLGHFCAAGASAPTPCPSGTIGTRLNLAGYEECEPCPAGSACINAGGSAPTAPCLAGHVCTGASQTTAPSSSDVEIDGDVARVFRPVALSLEVDGETVDIFNGYCPPGHFCPNGTITPSACAPGTMNAFGGGESVTDCTPCDPGHYCAGSGLKQPSGPCSAGYYCPPQLGSTVSDPASSACPPGSFCPAGSALPRPCPDGTYQADLGQADCHACPAAFICEFNTSSSISPMACPVAKFCPGGTGTLNTPSCPPGTYGAAQSLASANDCLPCPEGQYCTDGVIQGACDAGYECYERSYSPRPDTDDGTGQRCEGGHYCPNGTLVPVPCPNGTIVLAGVDYLLTDVLATDSLGNVFTEQINVSVPRLGVGAREVTECDPCPRGSICSDGRISDCTDGHYCDGSGTPTPCPVGTFSNTPRSEAITACRACPGGFWCRYAGTHDFSAHPCPPGTFCSPGALEPTACPIGSFRNVTGAASADDCFDCPGGYYCPDTMATSYSTVCPEGFFCPPGSGEPLACQAGFYCPAASPAQLPCPPSHYCPARAATPILCPAGHYCAPPTNTSLAVEGSPVPVLCPLGFRDRDISGGAHDRSSLAAACVACEAGKYGSHPLRAVCFDCEPGFVCLEGAAYGNPDLWLSPTGRNQTVNGTFTVNGVERVVPIELNAELPYTGVGGNGTVNGFPHTLSYICPPGYYCPIQSPTPVPCPAGTYNPANGTSAPDACIACPQNTFSSLTGQSQCRDCGVTSTAANGSTTCTCMGANRRFTPGDGTCVCAPMYESRNGETVLPPQTDGAADCRPKVYQHCGEGLWLNENGICLDAAGFTAYCREEFCPSGAVATPAFDPGLRRCNCITASLEVVCGDSCQAEERQRQYVECNNPPEFVTNSIADNGTLTESSRGATGDISLEQQLDFGLVACNYLLDGRRVSTYVVSTSADGVQGHYGADISASETASQGQGGRRRRDTADSDEASEPSRHRKRRAVVDVSFGGGAAIANPVACLQLTDVVMFGISADHYPTFDSDNLLNRQEDPSRPFDASSFVALAENINQLQANVTVFPFVFTAPGVWVIKDSGSNGNAVFKVMDERTVCPKEGPFLPPTTSAQHLLGIGPAPDVLIAPDWVTFGLVVSIGLAVLLVMVAAVIYVNRQPWQRARGAAAAYRSTARAFVMDDYSSKGSQVHTVAKLHRRATGPAPSAAKQARDESTSPPAQGQGSATVLSHDEDEFWDYTQQVDLESFDVNKFHSKLQGHTASLLQQMREQNIAVKALYQNIHREAAALKTLWVSKLNPLRVERLVTCQADEDVTAARAGFAAALSSRQSLGAAHLASLEEQLGVLSVDSDARRKYQLAHDAHVEDLVAGLTAVASGLADNMELVHLEARLRLFRKIDEALRTQTQAECRRRAIVHSLEEAVETRLAIGAVLLDGTTNEAVVDGIVDPETGRIIPDNGLVTTDERTGLVVPTKRARMGNPNDASLPSLAVPPDHFVNLTTMRVMPMEGNVVYNYVSGRFTVTANCASLGALPSDTLPFIPYPEASAPPLSLKAVLQQSRLTYGTGFRDPATNTLVPALGCTLNSEGHVVPVGGVYTDPLTGLASPIRLGAPLLVDGRMAIIVDVAFNYDTGAVEPLGGHGMFLAAPCSDLYSQVRGSTTGLHRRGDLVVQTVGGPMHALEAMEMVHTRRQTHAVGQLMRVVSVGVGKALEAGGSRRVQTAAVVSELETVSRDLLKARRRLATAAVKRRVAIEAAADEARCFAANGGLLGSMQVDGEVIPLFPGQILVDKLTQIKVPVLGAAQDAAGDGAFVIPLGGVMRDLEDPDEWTPITLGCAYNDPDTGARQLAAGAKLSPSSGDVVPCDVSCARLPLVSPPPATATEALQDEVMARRSLRRRLQNLAQAVQTEHLGVAHSLLSADEVVDLDEVEKRLDNVEQQMATWQQLVAASAKRQAEQSLGDTLPPPVLRLLEVDAEALQEAFVDVNRSLVGLVRRYVASLKDLQERFEARREELRASNKEDAGGRMYAAFKEDLRARLLAYREDFERFFLDLLARRCGLSADAELQQVRETVARSLLGEIIEAASSRAGLSTTGTELLDTLKQLLATLHDPQFADALQPLLAADQAGLGLGGADSLSGPPHGSGLRRTSSVPGGARRRSSVELLPPTSRPLASDLTGSVPPIVVEEVNEAGDAAAVQTGDGGGDGGKTSTGGAAGGTAPAAVSGAAAARPVSRGGRPGSSRRLRRETSSLSSKGAVAKSASDLDVEWSQQDLRLVAAEESDAFDLLQAQASESATELGALTEALLGRLAAGDLDKKGEAELLGRFQTDCDALEVRTAERRSRQLAELQARLAAKRLAAKEVIHQQLAEAGRELPPPTMEEANEEVARLLAGQQELMEMLENGSRQEEASRATLHEDMETLAQAINDGRVTLRADETPESAQEAIRAAEARAAAREEQMRKVTDKMRVRISAAQRSKRKAIAGNKKLSREEKTAQLEAVSRQANAQLAAVVAAADRGGAQAVDELRMEAIARLVSDGDREAARRILDQATATSVASHRDVDSQRSALRAKLAARRAKLSSKARHQQLVARVGEQTTDVDGQEALALASRAASDVSGYDQERLAAMEQEHLARLEAIQAENAAAAEGSRERLAAEFGALEAGAEAEAEAELARAAERRKAALDKTFRDAVEARRADMPDEQYQRLLQEHQAALGALDSAQRAERASQKASLHERLAARRVRKAELEARQRQRREEEEVLRQREEQLALQADLQAKAETETMRRLADQGAGTQDGGKLGAGKQGAGEAAAPTEAVVFRVLKNRHLRLRAVLKQQFEDRKQLVAKEALDAFTEQRAADRDALLAGHEMALARLALQETGAGGSKVERALLLRDQRQALAEFDRQSGQLQTRAVKDAVVPLDLEHGQAELRLRDEQYNEVSRTFKELSMEGVMVAQFAEEAEKRKQETEKHRAEVEANKNEQLARLKAARAASEEARKRQIRMEVEAVEAEVEAERLKQEKRARRIEQDLDGRNRDLIRQRESQLSAQLQNMSADERRKLVEAHKREMQQLEHALKEEKSRQTAEHLARLGRMRESKRRKKLKAIQEKEQELQKKEEETAHEAELRLKEAEAAAMHSVVTESRAQKHAAQPGSESPRAAPPKPAVDMDSLLSKIADIQALASAEPAGDAMYVDRRDAGWKGAPVADAVEEVAAAALTQREKAMLAFAVDVAGVVGTGEVSSKVVLKVASGLPSTRYLGNAFCNSYHYDDESKTLHLRRERLDSAAELVLVVIHALAHVEVCGGGTAMQGPCTLALADTSLL